jgi:hypothetical protein
MTKQKNNMAIEIDAQLGDLFPLLCVCAYLWDVEFFHNFMIDINEIEAGG